MLQMLYRRVGHRFSTDVAPQHSFFPLALTNLRISIRVNLEYNYEIYSCTMVLENLIWLWEYTVVVVKGTLMRPWMIQLYHGDHWVGILCLIICARANVHFLDYSLHIGCQQCSIFIVGHFPLGRVKLNQHTKITFISNNNNNNQ